MSEITRATEQNLVSFVYQEARILDAKDHDAWLEQFTEDGLYWMPLSHNQQSAELETSLMHEDKLLLRLRIERLKSERAFAQHLPSRCHHLLQQPSVESVDHEANLYVVRTEFHYVEAQGDEQWFYVGTMFHHLTVDQGRLRIKLKQVNLLNCEAALPSIQLFI